MIRFYYQLKAKINQYDCDISFGAVDDILRPWLHQASLEGSNEKLKLSNDCTVETEETMAPKRMDEVHIISSNAECNNQKDEISNQDIKVDCSKVYC